ncbi:21579_t:CDS:2, partial [Entrophospora sp. SA101]
HKNHTTTNQIINHDELPIVKDELSIILKIKLMSHDFDWAADAAHRTYTFTQADTTELKSTSTSPN